MDLSAIYEVLGIAVTHKELIGTITFLTVAITTGILYLFVFHNAPELENSKLPPLVGPSWWVNMSALTSTTDTQSMTHIHEMAATVVGKGVKGGETEHGAVFRIDMRLANRNYVVVTDYKLARFVFEGDSRAGIPEAEKTTIGRVFDLYPGIGSLFSLPTADAQRKATRKFLAPSFSTTNLQYTFGIVYKSLLTLSSQVLQEHIDSSRPLDVNQMMLRLTFDTIMESAFGVNFQTQLSNDNDSDGSSNDVMTSSAPFEVSGGSVDMQLDLLPDGLGLDSDEAVNTNKDGDVIMKQRKLGRINVGDVYLAESDVKLREDFSRGLNPFRKWYVWTSTYRRHLLARLRMQRIVGAIADRYRSQREALQERLQKEGGGALAEDMSIMGHLMRHQYADERRRLADMTTFITAGHETTSHTLTHLVLMLCRHPSVLTKVQSELDAAIPSAALSDRARYPSIQALRALPWLNACIDEAMRLWPVVGVGSKRIATCDLKLPGTGGMVIPKGSLISLPYFSIFRAPWIHRRNEFLPERWIEEKAEDNGAERSPSPFHSQVKQLRAMLTPFALGSRNCIGQNLARVELVMIASYLLRFFHLKLLGEEDGDKWSGCPSPHYEVFLSTKAMNVFCTVERRK